MWKTLRAREYYENFDFLLSQVLDAYERLSARFEFIVIEGAGSVTEMNLRRTDLVNMGFATRVGSPGMLVADIDRGGVFASIVGTYCLLPPEERALLRSWCVNRFRGDVSLFTNGVDYLQERTKVPCMGVFPYDHDIEVDAEDALSLKEGATASRVAILAFPRVSNLTDFRLLRGAAVLHRPANRQFDTIILPGTKATNADLAWLRAQGFEDWIRLQHGAGAKLIGICGGYQMLGRRIGDDEGLGYLDIETDFSEEKTTVAVRAQLPSGYQFSAYEIHQGQTERPADLPPFAMIGNHPEGVAASSVVGTYLHGALEDPVVLQSVLGISVANPVPKTIQYERLAAWFAANANTKLFEELYLC